MNKQQNENYLANLKQTLQGKVSFDVIQKFFSYFNINKAVFLRSIRNEYNCDRFENYLKEITEIREESWIISQLVFKFNQNYCANIVTKKDINCELFDLLKPIIIGRCSDYNQSRGVNMTKREIRDMLFSDLPKPIPTHDYVDMKYIDELGVKSEIDKIVCGSSCLVSHHLMSGVWNAINFDTRTSLKTFFEETIIGYSDGISRKELFNVDFDTKSVGKTQCYVNDVLLIYGEETANEYEMTKCLGQLHHKTSQMVPEVYGNIPFVLAYSIAGKFANFFAYTRQSIDENGQIKREEIPILIRLNENPLNMTDLYHRLIIFKITLNAIRFYHGCVIGLLFPERKPRFNLKESIEMFGYYNNLRTDEETVKTFERFDSGRNTKSLLKVYQQLKKNKIRRRKNKKNKIGVKKPS